MSKNALSPFSGLAMMDHCQALLLQPHPLLHIVRSVQKAVHNSPEVWLRGSAHCGEVHHFHRGRADHAHRGGSCFSWIRVLLGSGPRSTNCHHAAQVLLWVIWFTVQTCLKQFLLLTQKILGHWTPLVHACHNRQFRHK